jgi:hypothetical protein
MNLSSPIIDDNEKQELEDLVFSTTPELKVAEFLKLYNEDGMNNTIKLVERWLPDNFRVLNSFK